MDSCHTTVGDTLQEHEGILPKIDMLLLGPHLLRVNMHAFDLGRIHNNTNAGAGRAAGLVLHNAVLEYGTKLTLWVL